MQSAMLLSLLYYTVAHHVSAADDDYHLFWLCRDIANANYCFHPGHYPWTIPSICWNQCCSIHDNECTPINDTTPSPHGPHQDNPPSMALTTTDIAPSSSYYHTSQCLYETTNALYDLHSLEINPIKKYSHYLTYHSTSQDDHSPFYDQWISLYINICNTSSVYNTSWNHPPNTNTLYRYLRKSVIICGEYAPDTPNDTAVCTQIGNTEYHTQDFTYYNGDTYNGLEITLGKTACVWWQEPMGPNRVKQIYIKLVIQCDTTIEDTEVVSITGPAFSLDETNYPCDGNITITIKTNAGSCPRNKIFANTSHISCPREFNETTKIINCTLFTQNSQGVFTGNMSDFNDGYLSLQTVFGTTTDNITLTQDITIDSNKTGVFNITINVTAISENRLNATSTNLWQNITISASANYLIGPNTSTPNTTIIFVAIPSGGGSTLSSSSGELFGWIFLIFLIFIIIHLTCRYCYNYPCTQYHVQYIHIVHILRMKDIEAKKFFCGYCMRCKCKEYNCSVCLIGTYILCCDCGAKKVMVIDKIMNNDTNTKPLKVRNQRKSINDSTSMSNDYTFISFIRDRWSGNMDISDDMIGGSEVSAYSSTSEFLYRQQSGYGGHIGLDKQKSKSPRDAHVGTNGHHNNNFNKISISESDESYIL